MKRIRIIIKDVNDMKRFIIHSSKVQEPGVNVYKGNLVIDGSSVIAMMNLIDSEITVEYPEHHQSFASFVKQFSI